MTFKPRNSLNLHLSRYLKNEPPHTVSAASPGNLLSAGIFPEAVDLINRTVSYMRGRVNNFFAILVKSAIKHKNSYVCCRMPCLNYSYVLEKCFTDMQKWVNDRFSDVSPSG